MSVLTTSTVPSVDYELALKPIKTKPANAKGLLARLYDRMIEARMRQAQDVLQRHSHLIPRELEQAGWKVSPRSEDSLPFVR